MLQHGNGILRHAGGMPVHTKLENDQLRVVPYAFRCNGFQTSGGMFHHLSLSVNIHHDKERHQFTQLLFKEMKSRVYADS